MSLSLYTKANIFAKLDSPLKSLPNILTLTFHYPNCLLPNLNFILIQSLILSKSYQNKFLTLVQDYDDVFVSKLQCYNGSMDPFEATTNMGPVQPPQRKGRVPQYFRGKPFELLQKFDDLDNQGVFARPESLSITAESLNPSFLVKKKPSGSFRLVTAFADLGRCSKPQSSLMPDVDSTLFNIAQWKYLIKSDLTSALYQIPCPNPP